jgi:hypothetical protein
MVHIDTLIRFSNLKVTHLIHIFSSPCYNRITNRSSMFWAPALPKLSLLSFIDSTLALYRLFTHFCLFLLRRSRSRDQSFCSVSSGFDTSSFPLHARYQQLHRLVVRGGTPQAASQRHFPPRTSFRFSCASTAPPVSTFILSFSTTTYLNEHQLFPCISHSL